MTNNLTFEQPIEFAPQIELCNGVSCIPQHYLTYNHTLETVEQIIANIDFDDNYPIFVSQDGHQVYLQVGIIGFDNYQKLTAQAHHKIVYGRKWRVEPNLPTSEIIQTAFLAIKTAREHEIRELFQLIINGKTTTPFNNHHDLPLMAKHNYIFKAENKTNSNEISLATVQSKFDVISYNHSQLKLINISQHNQQWLVDCELIPSNTTWLPELHQHQFTLLCHGLDINTIYHQLMRYFITLSEQYVQDHFNYLGFARFAEHNDITVIAKLSAITRDKKYLHEQAKLTKQFEASNYSTDSARVPSLNSGRNSQKIRNKLKRVGALAGILPHNVELEPSI